jgi:hypothetical protein
MAPEGIQLLQSLLIHAPQVHCLCSCAAAFAGLPLGMSRWMFRLATLNACHLQDQSRLWLQQLLVDVCVVHGRLAEVTAPVAAWCSALNAPRACSRIRIGARCEARSPTAPDPHVSPQL